MRKQDILKLFLIFILVIIVYLPTFMWMADRWVSPDTSYSHGFLVPIISLFIIWRKRKTLKSLAIKPDLSGWLFFITGITIHIVSALWQVYFSSGFSLILVLIGLVLIFLGKDFLRHILFAILFLSLMIPLPIITIANLSYNLKIFASQAATAIIKVLGMPAVREGSIIKTPRSYIVVTDACSGIRSLITLLAMGILVAHFNNTSKTKKVILFLSSIPLAILANIIRISSLTLANEIYGVKFATGVFHNIMGILVFLFAFIGLALVSRALEQHE